MKLSEQSPEEIKRMQAEARQTYKVAPTAEKPPKGDYPCLDCPDYEECTHPDKTLRPS